MRKNSIQMATAIMAAILIVLPAGLLFGADLPSGLTKVAAGSAQPDLDWQKDLESALTIGQANYQPVFALFTSPDCPWCARLKNTTLIDPDIKSLLRKFSLAEIDTSRHERTATNYQIRGVPTMLILSSDGTVRSSIPGYLSASKLKPLLEQSLNPDLVETRGPAYRTLLDLIGSGAVPESKWPEIMTAMGETGQRTAIKESIFGMDEFPFRKLIGLLRHNRLAVRLGALELLEEHIGDNFEFDPWLDRDNTQNNREALAKFEERITGRRDAASVRYSSLTEEQVDAYIHDLLTTERQRALRAKRMLEQGGEDAVLRLSNFISNNPQLPKGVVLTIKEVQYAIMVPALLNMEPSVFAHRMIYGTLDLRLKCIAALRAMDENALPILRDFLADKNAIVRESVVDVIASIGGMKAAAMLKRHLESEKDDEVVYSVLNGLGNIRSKLGLQILKEYSSHANEDLAMAAIESIAQLESKLASEEIQAALKDGRWRVRVAALKAVAKIELNSLADKVAVLLGDEDDFVRFSAVKTLTKLSPGKEELDKLEKAFLKDDTLKGPVIEAFGSLDKTLPKSFAPALKGKPPEVLLAVLEGLATCDRDGVELASNYIDHPNFDVACAAVRLVAKKGMELAKMQNKISDILQGDENQKIMAALESITINENTRGFTSSMEVEIDLSDIVGANLDSSTNESSMSESSELDDLFGAFESSGSAKTESPPESSETTANQEPDEGLTSNGLDNLFASFESSDASDRKTKNESGNADQAKGIEGIKKLVEKHFKHTDNSELRFAAALLLLKLGETSSLQFLTDEADETTVDDRIFIANALGKMQTDKVHPLMHKLLNDNSKSVRRAMANSMLDLAESSTVHIEAIFEKIACADSNFDVFDIFNTYRWQYLPDQNQAAKRIMHSQALKLLDEKNNAVQNFGIILLAKTWSKGDFEKIESFLESSDPYQRRAAYYAVGTNDKEAFTGKIDALTADPSEYVRLVLPFVFKHSDGWRSGNWHHYLDASTTASSYNYSSSYNNRRAKLPEKARNALFKLTHDKAPKVRLAAFLCLLSNRMSIDLSELVDTIKHFPDRETISERIGNFMVRNYEELGPSFKVLLPYIDDSRSDQSEIDKIKKYFNVDGKDKEDAVEKVVYRNEDDSLPAEFKSAVSAKKKTGRDQFRIIYFTSPGCSDCDRVEAMISELERHFPGLILQQLNIKKVSAMQLNEALSRRYGVPEKKRLVTPAVFASGGFLVRKEISFAELGNLFASSASMSEPDWVDVSTSDLNAAEKSIGDRYSNMGMGFVVVAGLLDGVNPCAFATIIFLLSYLQVAKRKPFEIAQVGGAFVLAVFISYFVLGLGLAQLIAEMSVLQSFGRALTWAMSGLALIIMALNIRDGILCLRGRLAETTLQLPAFLKRRIHATVRIGARHRHFVVAAFAAGVAISFLELACTGQVYLPTILFMLNTGKDVAGALVFLLLYNLAFIAPLLLIFGCTYFGLKSDTLTELMQRHAALVKFATAALFLLLFIFLVYGDSLMVLMH